MAATSTLEIVETSSDSDVVAEAPLDSPETIETSLDTRASAEAPLDSRESAEAPVDLLEIPLDPRESAEAPLESPVTIETPLDPRESAEAPVDPRQIGETTIDSPATAGTPLEQISEEMTSVAVDKIARAMRFKRFASDVCVAAMHFLRSGDATDITPSQASVNMSRLSEWYRSMCVDLREALFRDEMSMRSAIGYGDFCCELVSLDESRESKPVRFCE